MVVDILLWVTTLLEEIKYTLFNDDCKIVNMNGECNYPNCSPMFEFNYTITDNGVEIFTTGNAKLEKQ